MRTIEVKQNSPEWLELRRGKVTGTKLGGMFYRSRKKGEVFDFDKRGVNFWEVLAERLTVDDVEQVPPMQRGHLLEAEAVQKCVDALGLPAVKRDIFWENDTATAGCSPDATGEGFAVEVKCLKSGKHLKAIHENKIPEEYGAQVVNYFLINSKLKELYFVMYDPRFVSEKLRLKIFTIRREDVREELEAFEKMQKEAEKQFEEILEDLPIGELEF